jgi:hypothetical protein
VTVVTPSVSCSCQVSTASASGQPPNSHVSTVRVPTGSYIQRPAAYDAAAGQFIMFGGAHYQHYNGHATWLWTGTTWTLLHPASTGPGRNSGVMTYDCATGQLVVFGGNGYHQNNYLNSTWSWEGTTWHRDS